MTPKTLEAAIQAAKTFLERAEALIQEEGTEPHCYTGSKASGAVRRQSMELTRALAELRRP